MIGTYIILRLVNLTLKHRGHITHEWGHDITHHCLLHKARRVHEQGIEPGIGLYLVSAVHRQALIRDLFSEPQHQGQGFVYRNLHTEGHFLFINVLLLSSICILILVVKLLMVFINDLLLYTPCGIL